MTSALLLLAVCFTLILNVLVIIAIGRRKRLRTPVTFPASILYIALALIDIVAALFWTLPVAIVTVTGDPWIRDVSSGKICKVQTVFMLFCLYMNGYILAALMFERFLRFYKPSKQKEIFFDFVVYLFLGGLVIFLGIISMFPLWDFGQIEYFEDQYQCAVDYPWSESHFQFTMVMQFGLPVGLVLCFYIAVLIRLCVLKKKRRAPNGDMIAEENQAVVGDSYSDRLKEIYARFKDAGSKPIKPKVKDEKVGYNNDGYHSDEDDVNYSDDDDKDTADAVEDYPTLASPDAKKRKVYYIARNDLYTAHMYFFMTMTYFGLWTPYLAWMVIYTYYYYDIPLSEDFILIAVIVSHFCSCLKVPWYLVSSKMRSAIFKTFICCKRGQSTKKKTFDAPHAVTREATTEL